jgi:Zn-dependent membrane protease YugP
MFTYLLIIGPFVLLALWAGARVKGTFAKYNQTPIRSGVSGGDAARVILRSAGISDVRLEAVPGMLSDHYDPLTRTVRLSAEVLEGRTPAAVAVAAHEVGHAIQHAQAYAPMKWRAALVPVVGFVNQTVMPMFLIGMVLQLAWLPILALILYGAVTLFHVVTLPVEFDASGRAMRILAGSGLVTDDEMVGVRKTLYAAGFTYIAATLVALAELVYWLLRSGLLGGRSEE